MARRDAGHGCGGAALAYKYKFFQKPRLLEKSILLLPKPKQVISEQAETKIARESSRNNVRARLLEKSILLLPKPKQVISEQAETKIARESSRNNVRAHITHWLCQRLSN